MRNKLYMNHTRISPNKKDFFLLLKQLPFHQIKKQLQYHYQEDFQEYLNGAPCCPKCQSTYIAFYDHCLREVYFDAYFSFQLTISRIYCQDCQRYSRILPDYLLPHKRYILSFICAILGEKGRVYGLTKRYRISRSLIRYWQGQFQQGHQLGLKVLEVQFPLIDYEGFLARYRKAFGYSFMQLLTATVPESKEKNRLH